MPLGFIVHPLRLLASITPTMTTANQRNANRENARRSTGPRTVAGKRRASMNALKHGILATSPVLPGEDLAAWTRHVDAVFKDLAPVGAVEEALAHRVALLLWRSTRQVRHETSILGAAVDKAPCDVARQPEHLLGRFDDDPFRQRRDHVEHAESEAEEAGSILGWFDEVAAWPEDREIHGEDADIAALVLREIADEAGIDIEEIYDSVGLPDLSEEGALNGWTAQRVSEAVAAIAATEADGTPTYPPEEAWDPDDLWRATRRRLARAAEEAREREARVKLATDRLRASRIIPDQRSGEWLTRYESHTSRELRRALEDLDRLQARRRQV